MKPILLDLFCGAGGAAMGYYRAGFEVVGVDIKPQPHFPFRFIQGDATTFPLGGFDAIHASPPCQAYSTGVSSRSSKWVPTLGKDEPALIGVMRERLGLAGVPWVIENVMGARPEMRSPTLLCGSMFGLDIPRHRLFETPFPVAQPCHPNCRGIARAASTRRGWEYRDMSVTGKGRHAGTAARWAELLGVTWPMTQHELAESIPPAYTEWIGQRLMDAIQHTGNNCGRMDVCQSST